MIIPLRSWHLLPALLLFVSALLWTGCSDDSSPNAPDDSENPDQPTTPDIPTVASPQDELPATSDFLTVESAVLRNLSPMIADMSPAMLAKLNEAHAMEFRLPASRNVLFHEGHACYPENMQIRFTDMTWVTPTRSAVPEPIVDLGSFQGSYYYLSSSPVQWPYADVNCRNFGAHLASVTSAAENAFLLGAVQDAMPGVHCFLGLTDWNRANNSWMWTSGETVDWTNWAAGEPNNSGGEYFAEMLTNGQWNDTRIANMYVYVLEKDAPLADLGQDPVPCAAYGSNRLFVDGLAAATVVPHVERRLYWERIFQVTLGAGASYSEVHSYKHGTSETTGTTFGWSIGISTELGWGPVSVQIESEFHQDFSHEVTISSEEEFSKTYEATAPADKVMVLALWHLRERYVITDGNGQPWSDPGFILDGPVPYLDQGLQQEYLQTILFDAR